MENPTDHWHEVAPGTTSTNIIRYGMVNNQLRVIFRNRGGDNEYSYKVDEPTICCRMAMASSLGRFFQTYIKLLAFAKLS